MNKALVVGGVVILVIVIAALVIWGQNSSAAGVKYTITAARGVVTAVDTVNKTVKVDFTKAKPNKAKDDLEGNNRELKVGEAKVVKVVGGKDKRVTWKNLAIGQEIGVKGTAKDDDTYHATFVRIHDRAFTVVGLLEGHNKTNKTLKINTTSSTYKPSTYKKGTVIDMEYSESNATFYSKSTATEKAISEVNANNQKVKVSGTITSSNTWEVKTLIDGYNGN